VGMELDYPCKDVVSACASEGMLVNCTMDTVLRFMPPLVVTEEEIDMLLDVLGRIFAKR
jgi:acetylornithine/N-succinyldiaminopimelate aminotransferase